MPAPEPATAISWHAGVQRFYVHQLGLLDDGRPDDWADLFTPDADFREVTGTRLHGREEIRASVRRRHEHVVGAGLDFFRHWLGMFRVTPGADGVVHARSYALAMYTPADNGLRVYVNVVCDDVLVPRGGGFLVRSRHLRADGR